MTSTIINVIIIFFTLNIVVFTIIVVVIVIFIVIILAIVLTAISQVNMMVPQLTSVAILWLDELMGDDIKLLDTPQGRKQLREKYKLD